MEDSLHSLQHVSNISNRSFVLYSITRFDSNFNRSITVFLYISISCFILLLFLSNFLLDITYGRNKSHPRQFPMLIECFMDQQKYFVPIALGVCLVVVFSLTSVAATETLSMSYTHACGLFEIAR